MDGDGEPNVMDSTLPLIPSANTTDVATGLSTQIDSTNDALSMNFSSQMHAENNEYATLTDGNGDLSISQSEHSNLIPIKHDERLDLTVGQVEMMEPGGELNGDSAGAGAIADDDQEYLQNSDPNEMKRVKVCIST